MSNIAYLRVSHTESLNRLYYHRTPTNLMNATEPYSFFVPEIIRKLRRTNKVFILRSVDFA